MGNIAALLLQGIGTIYQGEILRAFLEVILGSDLLIRSKRQMRNSRQGEC